MRRCHLVVSILTILFLSLTLSSCGGNAAASNKTPVATGLGASPSPTPAASPTPSAGATVLDNVEDTGTWLTCGNCGNDGATGPTAGFSFTPGVASPSEDGSSTQFSIAASVPFTNAYFYQQHTPVTNQISALTYEFDVYIPSGMETSPQGIEFECQQILDGWAYNFGWQALYPDKIWRIFDYGLKRWDSANVAFTGFAPGTWHHILAEYHNDVTAHTIIHDALTVDGTRFPVNITHNALNAGGGNQFTNAVQLDSNINAVPYSIYVDRMRITYK